MTQKEAIQNIIKRLDTAEARQFFLFGWLEDINWHTEANELEERKTEIGSYEKKYTAEDEVYGYIGNTKEKKEHEIEIAKGLITGFSSIFGYGIDDSWNSGGKGSAFVDELIKMTK